MVIFTVSGQWGLWSSWSDCSTTCGQGLRQRSRLCDSPPPSAGGAQCQGDSLEVTPCSNTPCLVSSDTRNHSVLMKFMYQGSSACSHLTKFKANVVSIFHHSYFILVVYCITESWIKLLIFPFKSPIYIKSHDFLEHNTLV